MKSKKMCKSTKMPHLITWIVNRLLYVSGGSMHFYDSDMNSKFLVQVTCGYNKKSFSIILCLKMDCKLSACANYFWKNTINISFPFVL